MALWTYFPLDPANPPPFCWPVIAELWLNLRDRAVASGYGPTWPKSNHQWDRFKIAGISTVTISGTVYQQVSALQVGGLPSWSIAPKRWVGWSDLANPWQPPDYDLVITDCDPKKQVRARIVDQTDDHTLIVSDLTQKVTERVIPSIASLAGKRAFIIKRGGSAGGGERIVEWPNDTIYRTGTASMAWTPEAGKIRSTDATFKTADLGRDVLFYNSSAVLQRGRITAILGGSGPTMPPGVQFTGTTGTIIDGGAFYIVAADGLFEWDGGIGPRIGGPLAPFRGAKDGYYSHHPHDDSLGVAAVPKVSVTVDQGAAGPPTPTTFPLIDEDPLTPVDDQYTPDKLLNATEGGKWDSADVAKGIRYLQAFAESIIPAFVKDRTYGVEDAIPQLTYPTLFNDLGINGQTSTITAHNASGINVALSVPWLPITVQFAVPDAKGNPMTLPSARISDGATYDGTQILYNGFDAGDWNTKADGKTVVVTLGWDSTPLLEFSRKYDCTVFVADEDAGVPVDPPTETFPGDWVTFPKSTHYLVNTGIGTTIEGTETRDAFAANKLARWVGQNFHDPTTGQTTATAPTSDTVYRDRAYCGIRAKATQAALNAAKGGKATGGSNRRIIDTAKNWYAGDFYTGGVLRTDSGTASGGGTTSLTDASKAASNFWVGTDRGARWIGFTVEVLMSGTDFTDPAAVIEKRLINSHTGATDGGTTIGWAEALPSSANGKAYRIKEPQYELNRYKGRTVRVTQGAMSATVTIDGNCDDTLFVPALGFVVDATATYAIDYPMPGDVDKRNADNTDWTIPTGTDARGVMPQFHKNSAENLADKTSRYGRCVVGDADLFTLLNQIYSVINALKKSWLPPQWTDNGAPGNRKSVLVGASGNICTWAELYDNANPNWSPGGTQAGLEFGWHNFATVDAGGATPPQAWSDGTWLPSSIDGSNHAVWGDANGRSQKSADAKRVYSYAQATIPQGDCEISGTVTFFVEAQIDGNASDPGHDDGEMIFYDDDLGSPTFGQSSHNSSDFPASTSLQQTEWHFDNNGDGPPVQFRKYVPWSTVTPDANNIALSTVLGNVALPFPDIPDAPGSSAVFVKTRITFRGWIAADVKAIVDWDFAHYNPPATPPAPFVGFNLPDLSGNLLWNLF